MDPVSLPDLRLEWVKAVLLNPRTGNPLPCWFGENVPGIDSCDGDLEGAHWIKRQRVEKRIAWLFDVPEAVVKAASRHGIEKVAPNWREAVEAVWLAAWDPRNGVPGCEKHHRQFDGQRVDARRPLIVWRHEVPASVELFCRDWGLDTALEDRNPAIGAGV